MQQVKQFRDRNLGDNAWIRVGLISTTLAAPLIARWNDLRRESKRVASSIDLDATPLAGARYLLERAQVATQTKLPQNLPLSKHVQVPTTQQRARPDTRLWLVGLGLGLIATGAVAYLVARRRLASRAEDLLELPLNGATASGQTTPAGVATNAPRDGHNGTATPATRGTMSTSGATLNMTPNRGAPTTPRRDGAFEPAAVVEPGMPEPEPTGPTAGTADPKTARYVGNIHTMIFHDIDDRKHLPNEENRVYFATEVEARESGFRADRDEISGSTARSSATEG